MIFNSKWFDNSRIDGFGVLEIAVHSGAKRIFVPLTRTHLEGHIDGPLADFTLSQTFRYSKEVNPSTIEALYRFPLPGDAAVRDVEVRFGEVVIRAELRGRETAETDYAAAKKEGKAAALMTRESPDVFTLQIAGIVPDEDVAITTKYIVMGMPEGTGFSFRIPLTTGPRYVRDDERSSRHAQGQPLAVLRDPGHRFSLNVTSGGQGILRCPTHQLAAAGENTFALVGGEVLPDRDCILVWEPVAKAEVATLRVFADDGPDTHFLALVTPPTKSPVRLPRDVIILVDHSGSMDGSKREAADWAVERFIAGLTVDDVFNLCLFESNTYWLFREPRKAADTYRAQATAFLQDTRSGGTELGVAIEQALSQPRWKGTVARHLIIITDGEVTDTGRIFRLVDTESGKKDARRCNILCIDSAPNSYFAQQVAERGGGISRFLTSSPDEEDITSALDGILSYWNAPVAVGLGLAVNRSGLLVDQRKVRKSNDGRSVIDLGDLPSGRSQWVVARAEPSPKQISFELTGSDRNVSPVSVTTTPAARALFGARLVAELESLMHAGYSDKDLTRSLRALGYDLDSPAARSQNAVYAENRMRDTRNRVKDLIVAESIRYGILSSETAFVAIRKEKGRKVEEQVIVPNALPDGWSDSFEKAFFMPKMSPRRSARSAYGGGILEWVGGGGGSIIAQPDGTMRMEKRTVLTAAGKSSSRIVPTSVPLLSHSGDTTTEARNGYLLFSGTPAFVRGEAVLFDSSRAEHAEKVPGFVLLKKLEFSCKGKAPAPVSGVSLLPYVGDMVVPRVRILLKDILDCHGTRPLNIRRTDGELLKLVLIDPDGEWEKNCPAIEVTIR